MQAYTSLSRKNQIPTEYILLSIKKTANMKTNQFITGSLIVVGLTFAGNWNVDTANSKVTFSIGGPFGTVHGSFSGLKATIQFDEKDLAGSSISASVEAKTVSTGIGLRNHDLRSKEQW